MTTTPLTDDEIVVKIREFAEARGLPGPASAEAAAEFEACTGYPMPALLRRVYCEAANGGFGPYGGLPRRRGSVEGGVVSLSRTGRLFSRQSSLTGLHREWISQPPEEQQYFPREVLPLVTLGTVWWCIDLSTLQGDMWAWDENACDRHSLAPQNVTLAAWLTDWLLGNDTVPVVPPVPGCPGCPGGLPDHDARSRRAGGTGEAAQPFGTILLSRASGGYRDFLRRYRVLLDGAHVGGIARGQSLRFEVLPGPHRLQLRIAWCSSPEVATEVQPGQEVRFSCAPGGGDALDAATSGAQEYIDLRQVPDGTAVPGAGPAPRARRRLASAIAGSVSMLAFVGTRIWHATGVAPHAADAVAAVCVAVFVVSGVAMRFNRPR